MPMIVTAMACAAASMLAGLGAAVVMVRRRKSAHDDKDAALMPRHAA